MSTHLFFGRAKNVQGLGRSGAKIKLLRAVVEALEQRRLLAVTAEWRLATTGIGLLDVFESSAGTDSITIGLNSGNVEVKNNGVVVTVPGAPSPFLPSHVKEIRVSAGTGIDTIDMSGVVGGAGAFTNLTRGVYLSGGPGDDNIIGSEFGDIIDGAAGNDVIVGGLGADAINGGEGDDNLSGAAGDDYINGDGFSEPIVGATVTSSEASGLIVGRRNTDVLFTIEDSGNPANIRAYNLNGSSRGSYSISGATNVDWEDLGYYRDLSGQDYIYIADIGDNNRERNVPVPPNPTPAAIRIYRVAEPDSVPSTNVNHGSLAAGTLNLKYPGNQPRDAESMFVDPNSGDIYIVSKRETGSAAGLSHLYRLASASVDWGNTAPIELEDMGAINIPVEQASINSFYGPSGASISPNGLEILLRSDLMIYHFARASTATTIDEMLTGAGARVLQAPNLRETPPPAQNRESVAFDGTGNTFYTVTETNGPLHTYTRNITGNDNLAGGDGADTLLGSAGNDWLNGQAGQDLVSGGLDHDVAYGGLDNDSLYGDGGNDTLGSDWSTPNDGDDSMVGGAGSDNYWWNNANPGNDTVVEVAADAGTDRADFSSFVAGVDFSLLRTTQQPIAGGSVTLQNPDGVENILGSWDYSDTLAGDNRANDIHDEGGQAGVPQVIYGNGGDDTMTVYFFGTRMEGGAGNDIFYGVQNAGSDTMLGGAGSDTYRYWAAFYDGDDTIIEEDNVANDIDTIDFTDKYGDLTLDLARTDKQDVWGPWLRLTLQNAAGTSLGLGIENVITNVNGAFNDNVSGNGRNNSIRTGPGTDTIDVRGGNDTMDGGEGNDILTGSAGSDTFNFSGMLIHDDTIVEGTDVPVDSDWLDFTNFLGGAVFITLGSTSRQQVGTNPVNGITIQNIRSIENARGTSLFDDLLEGDERNNVLVAMSIRTTLLGHDGNDTLIGSAWADSMDGGAGNDSLSGLGENDTMLGGDGNDSIYGDNGNDSISGGAGDDWLFGGANNDSLYGGSGNDNAYGGYGGDYLQGDAGSDSLHGETGADSFHSQDGVGGNDWLYGGIDSDLDWIVAKDYGDYVYNVP